MGAWGPGIFENDDAADWVYRFEAEGAYAVDRALSTTLAEAEVGFIDAPTGTTALAAGEAVASALGQPSAALSEEMRAATATHADAVRALDDVLMRTRRAVVAVLGQTADGTGTGSELLDLWAEDDASDEDFAAFKASVTDLALRLKAAGA